MRFYLQNDLPPGKPRAVFSNQSWRGFFVVTAIMAGIAGYSLIPKSSGSSGIEAGLAGAIALFFAILTVQRWRDCRHPANWLVRDTDEGLYFNLRPAVNRHLPEAYPTVLHLPAARITGVGKVVERRVFPDRNGEEKVNICYLEIHVAGGDLSAAADVLRMERRALPDHGGLLPHRAAEYPLQVVEGPALRIAWHRLEPGENKALHHLAAHYPKRPLRKIDYPRFGTATPAEKEAIIADLWETGHLETAERLIRLEKGVSAKEAKRMLLEMGD